jgi:hypothetical protein
MNILTATAWKDNAEMMAAVHELGYLDGSVLDCTYGLGNFWKVFQPVNFIGTDIDTHRSPYGISVDFTAMPFKPGQFTNVVFDPPYKLNGTPDLMIDGRYGVDARKRWQDRMALMADGLVECARVADRRVLLKCMDQVVAGNKIFQTIEMTQVAGMAGMHLVDRFDLLHSPRPQPPINRDGSTRYQQHTQQNYSTLLVFEKGKR